jgi:hypothetical protein
MAWTGQTASQAPQLMQVSLIVKAIFFLLCENQF